MTADEFKSQIKINLAEAEKELSSEDYLEVLKDTNFETWARLRDYDEREDTTNGR